MRQFPPTATYRVQLSHRFTFKDLKKIIPWLHQLGISTIYASPVFQARPGSEHGYDITHAHLLNPEIGTEGDWEEVQKELRRRGMTWLQDIVPNHMAYHHDNTWLQDVLKWGPVSRYFSFFDIDWNRSGEPWDGKLMAPFLGKTLEETLREGEVEICMEDSVLWIACEDHRFLMSARSYPLLFSRLGDIPELEFNAWSSSFTDQGTSLFESGNKEEIKTRLAEFFDCAKDIKKLEAALTEINKEIELLRNILDQQYFWLVPWWTTNHKINYRRFFTINELICLRQEDARVFEEYHRYIASLCRKGWIDGLRVDHIDGLYDPVDYLHQLRSLTGTEYMVVEKILAWNETLPDSWPVEGTTGYDFLATTNQLFTDRSSEKYFTKQYQNYTSRLYNPEELIYEKKMWVLENRMEGEFENLFHLLTENNILPENGTSRKEKWKESLKAVLCSFPVYRLYPDQFPLSDELKDKISHIFRLARLKVPMLTAELDFLQRVFSGTAHSKDEIQLDIFRKSQQLTGPLAAKGIEDTAFYLYNRLVSHNEVGDDPAIFGLSIDEFHARMEQRQKDAPRTMNTTATHDTKRGEDARMRINVFSSMPQVWCDNVKQWSEINMIHKKDGIPGFNVEYFLYQILTGAWPEESINGNNFIKRTCDYMQKALRESKEYSNWMDPEVSSEENTKEFIRSILHDEQFTASFGEFVRKVIRCGKRYSLGQLALKTTCPGVPDFYQGTEFWDLSYVDPDNRRPVDYKTMINVAGKNNDTQFDGHPLPEFSITKKTKMELMRKILRFRRQHPDLFDQGDYVPLNIEPKSKGDMMAFGRNYHNKWSITLIAIEGRQQIPDMPSGLDPDLPVAIRMPGEAPPRLTDILTGHTYSCHQSLEPELILSTFPVAILTNLIV